MVGERNRILEFIEYLNSLGIDVNISKNKARGNKGFFRVVNKAYRIDIAKKQSEDEIKSVLVHEFTHYIHYNYDKTLKSLDFIFENYPGNATEDLIELTVDSISKKSITPLFELKDSLKADIKDLTKQIKSEYPDFSPNYGPFEKYIKKMEYKHLLKHDKVKVLNGFWFKLYSIDNFEKDFPNENQYIKYYLKLLSTKRALKRINSRISRLNKYYNSPTELLARSLEYYICKPELMEKKTPNLYKYYSSLIDSRKIPMISTMNDYLKS